MFEFIEGSIVEKTPTFMVIQTGGIAYFINISLYSYSDLPKEDFVRLYIYEVIREDAHTLYGFITRHEREVFRQLISVSGIGANTARMILSSLTPNEVSDAIQDGNISVLQGIKGIGGKTAQRIIIDLKDKIGKAGNINEIFITESNTIRQESLSALVALGFMRKNAEKVVGNLLTKQSGLSVEEVIKQALKLL
ncbi:MAG: Holliday junction branch migration protein RuvA [Bacteroidales bacterium]|nr:Holliday junction branch migration protein RuvA [Bacteroidales bacterium]